ncbi:hypothetical protein IDG34_002637 [Escherichia coli]|nr:hypothetical protein [Escherichia coli]
MTIAIVIGTHGWAAEQLLKTAEMLLGEQENVGWIDFVPGENAETLIEKYNAQLAKLDTTKGVLFLVDTWGGSPFNAASRIVVDKEHYEVIAGVNIPMLVETLMALAFLQVNIIATALAIGCATLIMSTLGMMVGRFIGSIIGKKAEILGGLVLIGIGVQILWTHFHG